MKPTENESTRRKSGKSNLCAFKDILYKICDFWPFLRSLTSKFTCNNKTLLHIWNTQKMNVFFSFWMPKIDGPLIYTTKRYLHKYIKRHFLARLFKCNNKNLPSTLKFEVHTSKKELLFLFCMAQNRQRLFNLN